MANVDENGNPDPMYHSGWGDFSAFTTEAPCDKLPTNLTTSSNGANGGHYELGYAREWRTGSLSEMTNLTTGLFMSGTTKMVNPTHEPSLVKTQATSFLENPRCLW